MNDNDSRNAEIARLREALAEIVVQIERGDPVDSDGHPLVNLQAFHAAKAAAGEDALHAARSKPIPEVKICPLEQIEAKQHRWAIYRVKGTPADLLGDVEAPDEETAIKIEEFGITNPADAKAPARTEAIGHARPRGGEASLAPNQPAYLDGEHQRQHQ